MVVLICLIFSVLSTIEEYEKVAEVTLFWMVSPIVCFVSDLSEVMDFYVPNGRIAGRISAAVLRPGLVCFGASAKSPSGTPAVP